MKSNFLFFAVFAITIICEQAGATAATMPIMFVGDWCYESQLDKTTNYKLPSWTEDGVCKKILSVNPDTLYSEGWHCEPLQVQQKKDCAPSGCTFIALVVAPCQPDGPVNSGTRKLFEIHRYKGNLYVTEK